MKELIDTFEELKKYIYIVNRGKKKPLLLTFNNSNFYHLVGLHKVKFDTYLPKYIKSKDKIYKYIKNNIKKYDKILTNIIKEKDTLKLRIETFKHIQVLLHDSPILYDISGYTPGSVYDGDYGLFKIFDNNNCLLGLKADEINDKCIKCIPQSWMASSRINNLTKNKKIVYINKIEAIPLKCIDLISENS